MGEMFPEEFEPDLDNAGETGPWNEEVGSEADHAEGGVDFWSDDDAANNSGADSADEAMDGIDTGIDAETKRRKRMQGLPTPVKSRRRKDLVRTSPTGRTIQDTSLKREA